jgi:hypothetical protein
VWMGKPASCIRVCEQCGSMTGCLRARANEMEAMLMRKGVWDGPPQSKLRENVYFKTTPFVDGKAQPSGTCSLSTTNERDWGWRVCACV